MPDIHVDMDDLAGIFIETNEKDPDKIGLVIPFAQVPLAASSLRELADRLEGEYEEAD